MRRPLCAACLLFCAVSAVYLALAGERGFSDNGREGRSICVTGRVNDREYGRYGEILYLKDISWNTSFQSFTQTQQSEQKEQTFLQGQNETGPRGVLCLYEGDAQVCIGQRVTLRGVVKPFRRATNPGEFDERSYYRTKGLEAQLTDCVTLAVTGRVNRAAEGLAALRLRLEARLYEAMGEKDGSVLAAMLLGSKKDMDGSVKSLYQASGIAHILAISGLHISLLGMGLYRLLRKCGLRTGAAAVLCLLLLYAYGVMTGMSASSGRAVLMFALQMGARSTGRSYDMPTALAAAALVVLWGQPLYLTDCGFLLSFGALVGIGALHPALWRREKKSAKPLLRAAQKQADALTLNLSVLLMTLPVLLQNFYELPLYSILLNLVIVPLLPLLLPAGLLVSVVPLALARLPAALLCRAILALYEGLCTAFLHLPGSRLCIGHRTLWQISGYYGLLLLLAFWRGRRQRRLGVKGMTAGLLAAFLLLLWPVSDAPFQIHMLDVGQGDCFLVQAGRTNLLIDGGSSSKSRTGLYQMQPAFSYYGVSELDYVFVSHPDRDHYSGIEELLQPENSMKSCRVRRLILPENGLENEAAGKLAELVLAQGGSVYGMRAGQSIRTGKLSVVCHHPFAGERAADTNDTSLVLRLSYGNFSALFMGDLSAAHEAELLRESAKWTQAGPLHSTLLKAGHHGSDGSTGAALLEAVRPKLVLLSCGRDNRYGHPHPETLKRVRESGAAVYSTPKSGAVTVYSDGKRCRVEEHAPDSTD